jgi:hypothetical protein
VSTPDRVKKQKKKIAIDLGKLKKHESFWASVFGGKKLRKWIFVTPDVPDKDVVVHARKHAKKVRDQNLPFIDASFEAFVVTDKHFQRALDWRAKHGVATLDLPPDSVSQAEVDNVKSAFVANLERKLKQVLPNLPSGLFTARRNEYLRWYLEHENVLAKVFAQDAELFERIKNFRAQQEENVKFDSTVDDAPPNRRLANARKTLVEDLDRDFKRLGKATLNVVARGSIASWLGNCSLEFTTG